MSPDEVRKTGSSPWREPIVWLMILLVGASVFGSVQLLRVAVRDGPVDAVADDVRRTGQAQQADLGPDARALTLGLSAIVRIDPEAGLVEVLPVTGALDRQAPLQLHLRHPLRAAEDRSVQLLPGDLGWNAAVQLATDHDWLLQLSPMDAAWRLRGRLPQGQRAAHLAPALARGDDDPGNGSARP